MNKVIIHIILEMGYHNFLFLLVLIICLEGYYARLQPITEENLSEPFVIECLEELKTTREQVLVLEKNSSEDSYCLRSCILKKTGYFDKDDMIDIQKISEIVKDHVKDEKQLPVIMGVMQKCSEVNKAVISEEKEDCVRAKLFLECLEVGFEEKKEYLNKL